MPFNKSINEYKFWGTLNGIRLLGIQACYRDDFSLQPAQNEVPLDFGPNKPAPNWPIGTLMGYDPVTEMPVILDDQYKTIEEKLKALGHTPMEAASCVFNSTGYASRPTATKAWVQGILDQHTDDIIPMLPS